MPAPFDEMNHAGGECRPGYDLIKRWLESETPESLAHRRLEAELLFRRIGITFAVYGNEEAEERIIPFDIIPRVLTQSEWRKLSTGLEQRVRALNMFLADIYGPGEIIKAGVIPADLVYRNPYFRPEMMGHKLPHDIYVQIAGIDLVRTDAEDFYVLEDNARTPSGVSYMLENREVMMRIFPDLFADYRIDPVETYPEELLATLNSVAPSSAPGEPAVALLTPGPLNSAYYEHSFLADKLGIDLVEGSDLLVRDNIVFMRTTEGPKRVDVLYRRLDDDFLDPLTFLPNSVLGVPGLMNAYRAGNITLANAVGTGVADDKAVYSYMPEIVRFYLGAEPILKNVPTWRCREPDACAHVLDNLQDLVVKEVAGSGGYGMLIGPAADKATREEFARKIKTDPDNFIAQPTLALSTCPTVVDAGIAPRHVDLRPFVLYGSDKVRIVPGGLTRVALKEGSLVVNSSQGGGTKDTWVLDA
ncbi:MAG: circularly permuted type 2 ATP-grasp protein [Bauldia sp.]|uniref:circularly permuted type 2 ATP-grasp protein n=1 Tax=Bauldia sp. TaxID=2575872 RepID=UPI001E07AFA9|nr:circularly permuted type 2 ATP-grasp protein [Bauldia sp.]MCB1496612.1 circularly permuted type 2 ATP-grasp protein [Bauldia sp.]